MYKEIITKSLKDVFENYEAIIKPLAIPTLLLLIIEYISINFIGANQFNVSNIILLILSLLINMIILISVHRILILGKESVPTWGIKSYTKREFTFLLKYVGLIFAVVIALVAVFMLFQQSTLLYVILLVTAIVLIVVLSRVSLVFPSISIDENMSFKDSWNYTKDYKLLVFITVVLFPLIFSIVVGGIYSLLIGFLASVIAGGLNILIVLLNVAVSVFLVSSLSNTYMYVIYHSENKDDTLQDQ